MNINSFLNVYEPLFQLHRLHAQNYLRSRKGRSKRVVLFTVL